MNDLKDFLDPNIFHLLYADDLQVYSQVKPEDILEGINTINTVARNVTYWTKMVSLHLNLDKTKAIYFGSGFFVDQLDKKNLPGIDMGDNVNVPFVHEVKSLGVLLDS